MQYCFHVINDANDQGNIFKYPALADFVWNQIQSIYYHRKYENY